MQWPRKGTEGTKNSMKRIVIGPNGYKGLVSILMVALLLGVAAVPRSFADDAVKSEKTLDAAPTTAPVTAAAEKSRDVVPSEYGDGYLAQRLGATQHVTKVIGADVQDQFNFPLGKVKELLVNLSAGKIYCALVSVGSDDFSVAVPGRSFYPADNRKVQLEMTKDTLSAAPHFSTADWEFAALRKSIGDSYAHFNQKPLWDEKKGLERVNKAGDFIGMAVHDKDDQDLGKLTDLMVDLPTSRIVFAVISLDGTDKTEYAVPPEALLLTSDGKLLFLDESRDKVRERAHPDDYFYPQMSDRGWAANTYRIYGVEPDFDTHPVTADPTREQVRARVDQKVEELPPNKAAGKSDAEITRMILTAMVQSDMKSAFDHKNIKITTVNGHVVLSGRVKYEKHKSMINDAAVGVVGPAYVDNQIETAK